VQHGNRTTNFQNPDRTFRTHTFRLWWGHEWKDDEKEIDLVLGVVVVGCMKIVSGVPRRVSEVIIIHCSTCAICMTPNKIEAKLYDIFNIFLEPEERHRFNSV
jgi:hypothetical protein